jgi:hypothetical protein
MAPLAMGQHPGRQHGSYTRIAEAAGGRLLSAVKERGRTPLDPLRQEASERRKSPMPSLFRFLMVVGLLGGLIYATVFALATFVHYKPREIVVTVPSDRFLKPQH